jgi:hypothetical protein
MAGFTRAFRKSFIAAPGGEGLTTIGADTRGVTISAKVPADMSERTTAEARRLGLTASAVIGKTIVIPAPVIAPVSSF